MPFFFLSDLSAVLVWQQILPHLWRNPDQERMGDDRRSLCGQVPLAINTNGIRRAVIDSLYRLVISHSCCNTCCRLLRSKGKGMSDKIQHLRALSTHSSRTWRVVLGDHNINTNEGKEQYMSVSRVYIHPNWNSNSVAAGSVSAGHDLTHFCE